MPTSSEVSIDYDGLMQANLARVFGERDAAKRIKAIRELHAEDAVLNEPQTSAKGHAAISEAVTELLAGLPPDFVFTALGPAIGHHRIGRLRWRSGPPHGPVASPVWISPTSKAAVSTPCLSSSNRRASRTLAQLNARSTRGVSYVQEPQDRP